MGDVNLPLIFVLLLVLAAEFVNGWTDAPNAIATVVSTRVLAPRQAVLMAALFNVLGAFSGTAVADTVGKGSFNPRPSPSGRWRPPCSASSRGAHWHGAMGCPPAKAMP